MTHVEEEICGFYVGLCSTEKQAKSSCIVSSVRLSSSLCYSIPTCIVPYGHPEPMVSLWSYLPTEKTVCSPGRCLERGARFCRRFFLDRLWAHRWQELWSLPEWTVWRWGGIPPIDSLRNLEMNMFITTIFIVILLELKSKQA